MGMGGSWIFCVRGAQFFAPQGSVNYQKIKEIISKTDCFVETSGEWLHQENGIRLINKKTNNSSLLRPVLRRQLAIQILGSVNALIPETMEQHFKRVKKELGWPYSVQKAGSDESTKMPSFFIAMNKMRLREEEKDCKMQLRLMLTTPNFFEPNQFHKWADQHTATEFHSRTNYFKGPDRRACAEAVNALKAKGKRLPLDLPPVRVWAPSLPLSRPFHPYR
jgi:hypothetical protein